MKITKKSLAALLVATSCLSLTSCLDDDSETPSIMQSIVTIDGNTTDGFTFYVDKGGIIKPTRESVNSWTNGKGFSKKRASVYISYTNSNLKDVEKGQIIDGATLLGEGVLYNTDFLTAQEAEEKNINVTDSIFDIKKVASWCYRGYLTTIIGAPCSMINSKYIEPTLNIAYDPASIADNKLELILFYNRHTSKEALQTNEFEFDYTFPLYKLAEQIPGNDSIAITLRASGVQPTSLKVAREDLKPGNYLPFLK